MKNKLHILASDFWPVFFTPFLTITDVSQATGMPYSAIRTWINRGYVDLLATERPGRGGIGNRVLYSLRDAIQFLLFAETNRLGLGPHILQPPFAKYMLDIIYNFLENLTYDQIDLNYQGPNRYIYIYSFEDGTISFGTTADASLRSELFEQALHEDDYGRKPFDGNVWTVIDVVKFAKKVLDFFNENWRKHE